ncbi:hypothetical protein GF358_01085 [Candidatus Woesearchaeota archaeon]|nr:hypothetical protein [Candidatus Woesearchaeota archaeon]
MVNEWLVFSLVLLCIWFFVYLLLPRLRKEMLWVSFLTMPFGLIEPLFVPEYWNPPSLFNLVQHTGFDIESLIFCFSVGGIASVLYKGILGVEHKKTREKKCEMFHFLIVLVPVLLFILLHILTGLNPIYTASISMFAAAMLVLFGHPDWLKNIFVGGLLFTLLYFVFFLSIDLIFPGFVYKVWNLSAISGILVFSVPLEELMFAFTFGMFWSVIYAYLRGYRFKAK